MAPGEVGGEKQQERVKFFRGRWIFTRTNTRRVKYSLPRKYPSTRARLVPLPLGQGGFGDGDYRLPQALCALAMTGYKKCGGGGAHGPRPTKYEVRRGGALPLPRAGKSAKRRRWRMQRAGFEEVPRLADTTVAGNRLARRWAREPRPYGALHGVRRVVDVKKLGGFLVIFNHLKILLLFCNFYVAFLIDLCYTKLR